MNRKTLLSLLVVVLVASFVSACSSSKKAPPPITVQLAPAPPGALEVSHSVQIGAQVTSDTAGAGVDWTLACTSADCGSIAPAHTASGGATTYTAPSVVPTGGTVTITATSTTDTTQSASADVTINPLGSNGALANGNQYAFLVTGIDTTGFYSAAGSFTTDGAGNITDGEEDYTNVDVSELGDTLTGTYNIGSDGRGTITLTAQAAGVDDPNVGVAGVETFSVSTTSDFVNNPAHLLITQADGSATSSGTIDLQNAGAFGGGIGAGNFVLAITGQDLSTITATTFGGVLSADGAGNFGVAATPGSGGFIDGNDGGASGTFDPTGGTYTTFDANGRGTATFLGLDFTLYMVGPEVFRIVETDTNFMSGGSVYGAAPGAAFATSAVTGSFVFVDNGQESAVGPVGAAGQITAVGDGTLSAGFADASEAGTISSGAVTGTYTVPDSTLPRAVVDLAIAGGTGNIEFFDVYLTDPALNLLDPNNTAVQSGALLMENDATANGIGFVIEQADPSTSTVAVNYGINLQLDPETGFESDFVGQGVSDGAGNINGNLDFSAVGTPATTVASVMTFAADGANPGRATGTIDIGTGPGALVYYQVTTAQVVFIFADPTFIDAGVGFMISQ
jgi:hypothetical protein